MLLKTPYSAGIAVQGLMIKSKSYPEDYPVISICKFPAYNIQYVWTLPRIFSAKKLFVILTDCNPSEDY